MYVKWFACNWIVMTGLTRCVWPRNGRKQCRILPGTLVVRSTPISRISFHICHVMRGTFVQKMGTNSLKKGEYENPSLHRSQPLQLYVRNSNWDTDFNRLPKPQPLFRILCLSQTITTFDLERGFCSSVWILCVIERAREPSLILMPRKC